MKHMDTVKIYIYMKNISYKTYRTYLVVAISMPSCNWKSLL